MNERENSREKELQFIFGTKNLLISVEYFKLKITIKIHSLLKDKRLKNITYIKHLFYLLI